MILSAVHSKQWDQRAEQRWRWRKQDRAAPRPQGFIVSMSEWLEPCAGVLGVSASYIRSAFPTPSNRPLRPRLRAYRRVALDFRTTADNILDLIANFPNTSTTGFVNRRSGVQSSQPAPRPKPRDSECKLVSVPAYDRVRQAKGMANTCPKTKNLRQGIAGGFGGLA